MASYNPYNSNFYMQDLQAMRDRIDRTMQQYQQNQYMQPQQQAPITQNFQLAPQTQNPNELQSAYVNGIDEVKNIFVTKNGVFVDKNMTTLWEKNTEGKIRTFSLIEVVEKDEKDVEIDNLKKQNEEMKTIILQLQNSIQQPEEKKKNKKEDEQ